MNQNPNQKPGQQGQQGQQGHQGGQQGGQQQNPGGNASYSEQEVTRSFSCLGST